MCDSPLAIHSYEKASCQWLNRSRAQTNHKQNPPKLNQTLPQDKHARTRQHSTHTHRHTSCDTDRWKHTRTSQQTDHVQKEWSLASSPLSSRLAQDSWAALVVNNGWQKQQSATTQSAVPRRHTGHPVSAIHNSKNNSDIK